MRELIYKNEALPLHFGLRALSEFATKNNMDLDSMMSGEQSIEGLNMIVSLAVFGLNLGARKAGKEDRYDEEFVWDMFEEEPSLIYETTTIFQESMTVITSRLGSLAPKKAMPAAPSENQ